MATRMAVAAPARADQCGFTRRPARKATSGQRGRRLGSRWCSRARLQRRELRVIGAFRCAAILFLGVKVKAEVFATEAQSAPRGDKRRLDHKRRLWPVAGTCPITRLTGH